jgi:hypothetical protein
MSAGLINAFAGVLYTGTTGAADPGSGLSYLFLDLLPRSSDPPPSSPVDSTLWAH